MTIVLIAVLAYFVATGLLLRSVSRERPDGGEGWRWPALAAVLLHAGYHAMVAWRTAGGPDLHFYSALSLVALGMAAMTVLVGVRGRTAAVGVVVFPLAATLLLAYHGHGHAPSPALGWRLQLHAWLALLAYATLAIAALLATMLTWAYLPVSWMVLSDHSPVSTMSTLALPRSMFIGTMAFSPIAPPCRNSTL